MVTATDLTEIRRRRHATHTLRASLEVPQLSAAFISTSGRLSEELSGRIVSRVFREVTTYATLESPQVRSIISQAVGAAVDLFLDVLADRPCEARRVFDLFRHLGQLQQAAGHDLDAMRAAHQVATQESWDEIRSRTADLPAEVTTRLVGSVFAFQRQLLDEAMFGYVVARGGATTQRADAHARLVGALLTGAADVEHLAHEAGWPLPEEIRVATLRPPVDRVDAIARAGLLSTQRDGATVVLGRPSVVMDLVSRLGRDAAHPVAVSWAVPWSDARHAHRWTTRVLDLVADGSVRPSPDGVVRCSDHQNLLWLSADPALNRRASQEILQPLLRAGSRNQAALAETLTLWLQTRGSAVAIAQTLGVHAQTVRQRLRQLHGLFGDQLDDPTMVVGLLAALESTAPLRRRASQAS